jgi:hypothetical protein
MAAWVLEDWPDRFIGVCKEAGLRAARIIQGPRGEAPYWLWKVTDEYLGLRLARWKRFLAPEGICISYEAIGRRLLSRRLLAQEQRIGFIRVHPEFWADHLLLAKAMKAAGLYSPRSEPTIIMRHCPTLLRFATESGVPSKLPSSLSVHANRGRKWIVRSAPVSAKN